jgi:hypothetical protein
MKRNRKYNFLSILILFALLLTSCGGAGAETDAIATAVAMTVAAQGTEKAQATATPEETEAAPTSTPEATEVASTPTTALTFAPPTAPGPVGSGDPCLLANLISETIPDGTIMQPGETFWKTWRLKNNGTCTWNSAYKIVYWSGDLMGGLLEYQLPEDVSPGEEVDITLYLKAPTSNGNFSSYWKLQSEWGGQFGVGQYDQPFYVQVNVNDSSNPSYGVANVTYNVVRDPATGCATNVWYYVNATITTNGPAVVKYQWLQSDGNNTSSDPGPNYTLKFTEAGSKTVTRSWSFHLGATPGTKWMKITIHEPNYQEFPQQTFVYDCQ